MIIRQLTVYFLLLGGSSAVGQSNSGSKVGLNHIALMVKNLDSSLQFYQNIMGLDTIPEPFHDGKHVWLSLGGKAALHLIYGPYRQQSIKQSHICLSVPAMDLFLARLNAAHMPYENWPGQKQQVTKRVDGVQQVYLQDPDGYWIEINDVHE